MMSLTSPKYKRFYAPTYQQIEAGKINLEAQPIATKKCVDDVADMFRDTQKNVHVKGIVESDVCDYIIGDATSL